jgi:hypothetical protein
MNGASAASMALMARSNRSIRKKARTAKAPAHVNCGSDTAA